MKPPSPDWSLMALADGRMLSYRSYGDPAGVPVLAIHGAPATGRMYRVADDLARRRGLWLIAPDRPGYAGSTAHPGRTVASVTSDHLSLLEHLKIGTVAVLGISGGGPYACALAARLGLRAATLSLVSPVGEFTRLARGLFNDRLQAWFFLDLPKMTMMTRWAPAVRRGFFMMPRLQHHLFALTLAKADRVILKRAEIIDELTTLTADAMRHSLEGGTSDLRTYSEPWDVDLGAITARTTIWQGTADTIVPPEAAYALAERIPNASLFRLEKAGHFWIYDHMDEVLTSALHGQSVERVPSV